MASEPSNADSPVVLATQAIANVVKSSFGPSGLDKMMVDDIGVGKIHICPLVLMLTSTGCHCHKRWCHHSQLTRRRAPSRQDIGGPSTATR